jgi:hypothetical protein
MRNFFLTLTFLLSIIFTTATHAATFPFSKAGASGVSTSITVTTTASTASLSLTIKNPNRVTINKKLVVYSSSTCALPALLNENISMLRTDVLDKTFVVGTTASLKPDTEYCFRYTDTGWTDEIFKTDAAVAPTSFSDTWPLTPSVLADKSVILAGKVDTTKYTGQVKNLTIELQYSSTPDTYDKKAQSISNTTTNALGIAADGTYYFNIGNSLTPGATYYIREVLTDSVSGHTEQKTDTFVNTDKGLVLEGSAAAQDDFEKRSYRLLAPFPGLAVLLDPSQCGAVSAGKICSINDLLNFIFKILIGVTAVSLVFRLIWDGYRIMTTDVPFIKVNAKSDFFTALGGLLLALSAYIILNTINPKLVSNDISIQGVGVGVIVQPLSEAHQYRLAQTQDTPGAKKFARTPYYDQIKSIVAATAPTVPHCLLQVAIQRESSGGGQGVQLIGHDEDVDSDGIRSRKDFIASGKKSDGTTFSGASITDAGFKNTDHTNPYTTKKAPNPSASDLGLDWRFTHSVGMFGTTFGPKAGLVSDAKKIYNGSTDLDITIAAKNMENFYDKCNHDIKGTWTSYGAWACTLTKPNSFLDKEVPIRIDLYNQCVLQDK